MAKIMFFAHDPGGANAISPLIEPLKNKNEVFVFANGPALLKFPNSKELQNNTLETIMPDFLITGTSANNKTEKDLWKEAKKLNIKSLSILDHWVNYGIRFSKYGLNEIEKFDKKCEFLPDFIIVMDEFAKQEMKNEGVPADIIYPLGNPHFEQLIGQSQDIRNIRANFAKDDEFLITFASEPYIEDYGQGEEKSVLKDLIEIAKDKNIKIIVKLHPKEAFSKYAEFKNSPNIILDKNTSPIELIMASDLVVSMTSMFLIEAMILGKNILSYQPNETDSNRFILTKNKILPFVNNKKDFGQELDKIINDKQHLSYNHNIQFNSIEKIISFIDRELCK